MSKEIVLYCDWLYTQETRLPLPPLPSPKPNPPPPPPLYARLCSAPRADHIETHVLVFSSTNMLGSLHVHGMLSGVGLSVSHMTSPSKNCWHVDVQSSTVNFLWVRLVREMFGLQ